MSTLSPASPVPHAPSLRPDLTSVLTRSVVVAAVGIGVSLSVDAIAPTQDANIGAGLLALAAVLVVTTGWAFVDGRRTHVRGRAVVLWLAVCALAAVLQCVGSALTAVVLVDSLSPADAMGLVLLALVAAVSAFVPLAVIAVGAAAAGEWMSTRRPAA